MDFGHKLRVIRAYQGISQQDLGQSVPIESHVISLIERGKVLPTPQIEDAIRTALKWPKQADEVLMRLGQALDADDSA